MRHHSLKPAKAIIAMAALGMGAYLSATKGTTDVQFHNDYYDYIELIFDGKDLKDGAGQFLKIQDLQYNKVGSAKEDDLLKDSGGKLDLSPCHGLVFSFDFKRFSDNPIHRVCSIPFTVKSTLEDAAKEYEYVVTRYFHQLEKETCYRGKIQPKQRATEESKAGAGRSGARLRSPSMDGAVPESNMPFSFSSFSQGAGAAESKRPTGRPGPAVEASPAAAPAPAGTGSTASLPAGASLGGAGSAAALDGKGSGTLAATELGVTERDFINHTGEDLRIVFPRDVVEASTFELLTVKRIDAKEEQTMKSFGEGRLGFDFKRGATYSFSIDTQGYPENVLRMMQLVTQFSVENKNGSARDNWAYIVKRLRGKETGGIVFASKIVKVDSRGNEVSADGEMLSLESATRSQFFNGERRTTRFDGFRKSAPAGSALFRSGAGAAGLR